MHQCAPMHAARAPVWIALLVAAGACAGRRGAETAPAASSRSSRPAERMHAWAELASEAAGRATSACQYYSRASFSAGHAGRFEPERHGPCVAPADAALHARVADLALVAAHLAGSGDAHAEAAIRVEVERTTSPAPPEYVRAALASLDQPRSSAPREGCERAAAAVVRGIEALAVRARAEAVLSCPADAELPPPPSTSYLVPSSRCGADGAAQLHATAAHALLLASRLGATARADEELAWVHDWVSEAGERGRDRAPDYASRALRLRSAIEAVSRCQATAELLPARWEADCELRRVPGTGVALRVPRGSRLGHGAVELGGALEVRVSIADEPPHEVLARLGAARAVRLEEAGPPRWLIRHGRAPGRDRASGVSMVADLGDLTAVLTAAHFLPVAEGLWDRVAAVMATVERASGSTPLMTDDLGVRVGTPGLAFVSFEPGRVRFSSDPGERDRARVDFSAGLVSGAVIPSERAGYCQPEEALPLARRGHARVLVRRDRITAGARGCEVAAVRRTQAGTRFEYAAFGFLADGYAEVRVSAISLDGDGANAGAMLERARAWTDAVGLVAPPASTPE